MLAHGSDNLAEEPSSDFEALIERREQRRACGLPDGAQRVLWSGPADHPAVLVPRPETESVVDVCLKALPLEQISQLADIGTGSGAILVAAAVHRPRLLRAFGTEISPDATCVAQQNCDLHRVGDRVTLYQGNLLEPLSAKVNVIAANLPYVPPGEASPEVATWEPQAAVFGGGDDGTALIREFLVSAPDYLLPGGIVVMETAHSQGKIVSGSCERGLPNRRVKVHKDLSGYDRIVVIKTP